MTLSYKVYNPFSSNVTNINACKANDEWPEIASSMPIQQVVSTSHGLSRTNKTEQVNIKNLSENNLKELKTKDPFMYYSIHSVRHAAMLFKDEDSSSLDCHSTLSRNCISCPSRIQTQDRASSENVKRCSRISFECHSLEIFANLMEDSDDEAED